MTKGRCSILARDAGRDPLDTHLPRLTFLADSADMCEERKVAGPSGTAGSERARLQNGYT